MSHGAQPFADERRPFASRTIRAAIVVGVLAWSALRGFGTVSASDFDQLAERPGAEVTRSTSIDGSEHTTIRLPGGVSITRITRDGKSRYLEMDESGRGAVMCIWEIYVALLAQMRVCSVADDGFEEELTRALDRMNDFIVANSLSPVTKNDAEDAMDAKVDGHLAGFSKLTTDQRQQACRSHHTAVFLDKLRSEPREDFRRGIADMLSVPRPPVLNPCL